MPTKHVMQCMANVKRYIERNRAIVNDYLKDHPCVDCGNDNPVVLEFDHVRGEKKRSVAKMVRQGLSVKTLMAEIAKCEVRCANCHRIKTATQLGWHNAQQ